MAKIFYSMCGEGRGHAARVRTVVDHLRHEHHLVLFAPEQAYEFLAPRYPAGTSGVEIRRIPGLRFHYTGGRLDLCKSIATGVRYLFHMQELVRDLTQAIDREQPDLVITDFEPALPRAAERCGVPYISLDHQHFLVACDLRSLPFGLRNWARLMSIAVRMHHTRQKATIVSSFFQTPLLPGLEHVRQVGPLLRPEVTSAEVADREYVVSYLRPHTPPSVLELLHRSGRSVKVYGLGERESDGRLSFCKFDDRRFVEDVAGCAAVVGAAGNQTLGESLYLGKPILALPERQHHEQRINGHFVEQMGAGMSVTIEDVQSAHVERFFDRLDRFQSIAATLRGKIDGTAQALAAIGEHLPQPAAA